ncbi:LuxR C-terminal-related transcriptional regulator [Streptomyces griseoluteus]|uniref:helix-turn-helix transcriptional regulator n=1 Tax=Streptomyces griseoluteus TaxID=29306 RepID=UPI0037F547A2
MPAEALDPRALAQFRQKLADAPDRPNVRTLRTLLAEIDRLNGEIERLRTSQTLPAPPPVADCPLTRQQISIQVHAANGLTSRETAVRMGVSEQAMQKHKHRIYQRLGVHTSAAAVALCLTRGWLPYEELRLPELPRNTGPSLRGVYLERAARLRERRGEWDTVAVYGTAQSARQGASRIRRGHFAAFRPAGQWEAESFTDDSTHMVRARYIGPPVHTERTAS